MGKFSSTITTNTNLKHEAGSRTLVRTENNVLYFVCVDSATSIEVWKSSDEGATWAEQDSGNKPTKSAGNYYAPSVAIDDAGILRILYLHYRMALMQMVVSPRYVEFDTSSDTYQKDALITSGTLGNIQTIITSATTAIAYSNTTNSCHILWSDIVPGSRINPTRIDIRYQNGNSGSWSATQVIANDMRYADIMISNAQGGKPIVGGVRYSVMWFSARAYTYIADAATPTAWTAFGLDTSVGRANSTFNFIQCCDDAAGDQWVIWADTTSGLKIRQHKKADSWATWQTVVVIDNSISFNAGSLATRGYQHLINEKRAVGNGYSSPYATREHTDFNEFQTNQWTALRDIASHVNQKNPSYKWAGDNNFGETAKVEGVVRNTLSGVVTYFSDDLDQVQ